MQPRRPSLLPMSILCLLLCQFGTIRPVAADSPQHPSTTNHTTRPFERLFLGRPAAGMAAAPTSAGGRWYLPGLLSPLLPPGRHALQLYLLNASTALVDATLHRFATDDDAPRLLHLPAQQLTPYLLFDPPQALAIDANGPIALQAFLVTLAPNGNVLARRPVPATRQAATSYLFPAPDSASGQDSLLLFNPAPLPVRASLYLLDTTSGTSVPLPLSLPAASQAVVDLGAWLSPLHRGAGLLINSDRPIVAARGIVWDQSGPAALAATILTPGLATSSSTWYFAGLALAPSAHATLNALAPPGGAILHARLISPDGRIAHTVTAHLGALTRTTIPLPTSTSPFTTLVVQASAPIGAELVVARPGTPTIVLQGVPRAPTYAQFACLEQGDNAGSAVSLYNPAATPITVLLQAFTSTSTPRGSILQLPPGTTTRYYPARLGLDDHTLALALAGDDPFVATAQPAGPLTGLENATPLPAIAQQRLFDGRGLLHRYPALAPGAPVRPSATRLTLTLTPTASQPRTGVPFTLSLRLSNDGFRPASGLLLAITPPPAFTLLAASADHGNYAPVHRHWLIPALPSGVTATLVLRGTIAGGGPATLRARLLGDDQQDHDLLATATIDATTSSTASQLALTYSAFPDTTTLGQQTTLTATVQNQAGTDAHDLAFEAVLPSTLAYDAARPSAGVFDPTTARWTLPRLPAGAGATLTLTVTTLSTGSTTASVARAGAPVLLAQTTLLVLPRPDLALSASTSAVTLVQGASASYLLTLANVGQVDVSSLQVAAPLPAGVTPRAALSSPGTFYAPDGTWTIPRLPAGASATLTLLTTLDELGPRTLTATLNLQSLTAIATIDVQPAPTAVPSPP